MIRRVAFLVFLGSSLAHSQYLNVSAWAYPTPDLGGYRELQVGMQWSALPAGGNAWVGATTGTTFVWVDFNMGYEPLAILPETTLPFFSQPDAQIWSPSSTPLELIMPQAQEVTTLGILPMAGTHALVWYYQPVQAAVSAEVARGVYPPALHGTPVQVHIITHQDGELSGSRWWYRLIPVEL